MKDLKASNLDLAPSNLDLAPLSLDLVLLSLDLAELNIKYQVSMKELTISQTLDLEGKSSIS